MQNLFTDNEFDLHGSEYVGIKHIDMNGFSWHDNQFWHKGKRQLGNDLLNCKLFSAN